MRMSKADRVALDDLERIIRLAVELRRAFPAAVEMAESYLKDKRRILPCAAYLRGEYGVKGLYVGVPCIIGAKGVERVVEIKLDAGERARFRKSAAAVRSLIEETRTTNWRR